MVYLDDAYVQIAPEEYKSYQENVRNAHEYLHSGQNGYERMGRTTAKD